MERAKTWLASYLENDSSTRRILSMEGQRGIAVALVFLVHYVSLFSPWLTPGSAQLGFAEALKSIGFIGVDFFFVISGYLIYGIVVRKAIDHRAFALRRLERIYPVFLVMFAIYCVLAIVVAALRLRGWRPGARIALITVAALAWLPLCHALGLGVHAKTVMFAGGM